MDDVIDVSGAYPRPIIGRKIERNDTGMVEAETEMKKRSGVVLKTRPQKVVVAKAGDMAYGFASFEMEFDRPDSTGKSEHVKFEGSQLTVWRKADGEWRLAASFNRPNESVEGMGAALECRLTRGCSPSASLRTGSLVRRLRLLARR